MAMRRIATYSGRGSVLTDDREVPVSYHLDVFQDFREGAEGTRSSSLKRIEGSVHGAGIEVSPALLTLITQENHRLQFFLVRADGTITGTSSFLTADGRPVL